MEGLKPSVEATLLPSSFKSSTCTLTQAKSASFIVCKNSSTFPSIFTVLPFLSIATQKVGLTLLFCAIKDSIFASASCSFFILFLFLLFALSSLLTLRTHSALPPIRRFPASFFLHQIFLLHSCLTNHAHKPLLQ